MKEKRKYSVKKLLAFVNDIEEILGGAGVIDYIAVTPDEFSIYIQHGVSMLLVNEIDKFKDVFSPDTVFFNENNPQLIIANTRLRESTPHNDNISYFIDFVNDCAEFICPCTGSEIHIQDKEIKIFIDQINLLHSEYIGVYSLLNEDNLIFKLSLNNQRPYLSIISREDVFDE